MLCCIVGGGPSLCNFDWSILDNHFVIALNRAYEVLPKAQIIYFTDRDFHERHWEKMEKHGGMLIRGAINPDNEQQHPRLAYYKLANKNGFFTEPGKLAHGSNSGYAALNLAAAHLHFKKIALLGLDMQWNGDKSHWHSGHKRIDADSTIRKWAKHFDDMKEPLDELGCEVFNVNPNSGITAFPQVPFEWLEKMK